MLLSPLGGGVLACLPGASQPVTALLCHVAVLTRQSCRFALGKATFASRLWLSCSPAREAADFPGSTWQCREPEAGGHVVGWGGMRAGGQGILPCRPAEQAGPESGGLLWPVVSVTPVTWLLSACLVL